MRALLKVIGQEFTRQLLCRKAEEAPTLELGGKTYYRKAASAGHYQTLYGEVVISRHRYQTSAGGPTLCPIVSFKLASATAGEVAQDLAESQGVALSAPYLHHLAQQVGQIAMEKQAAWHLETAAAPAPVATSATGVDGPTLPVVGEAYKEA